MALNSLSIKSLYAASGDTASSLRRAYALWREMAAGRSSYPVFRRELLYWHPRLSSRWRVEELFALLTLISLCLLPASLMIFPGALLAYAALDELMGLFAALPAAALVVREREAQTWNTLRATPLTSFEIASAKLAGVIYLVWESVSYLVVARWLGTLLALPLLALMLTLPQSFPLAAGRPVALSALALLFAYLAFVYRPLLNLICGGCLGLAASTLTPSRSRATALAMVVAGFISVGSGALLIWYSRAADLRVLFSQAALGGQLERIFIWLIPLSALTLGRLLLVPMLFGWAVYRIGRVVD